MRHLSAVLLLTPFLSAQGAVSPRHFTHAEGNSYSDAPFGTTTNPYRYLQIHGDVPAMTISSLAVRRDVTASAAAEAGYGIIADVFLSTAASTVAAPSPTFDSNHGTDKTQVASFKFVNFPATANGPMPRPFEYKIAFDRPFVYGATGPLCWEIRIQSRQNQNNPYHDLVTGSSTNPPVQVNSIGTGCRASGYTSPLFLTQSTNTNWPGGSVNFTYTGSSSPKSTVVFLMMGINDQNFSGIPLPFELPTTRGSASGECRVYLAPVLLLPTFTTASGNFLTNFGLPATPEYNGARLLTQVLAPDASANPIGVVTSNMVSSHWTAPYALVPLSKVSLFGSLGTTGTATVNNGLVVLFE
jgi:hypothetical protein